MTKIERWQLSINRLASCKVAETPLTAQVPPPRELLLAVARPEGVGNHRGPIYGSLIRRADETVTKTEAEV